jgi:hypothetical protein
MRINVPRPATGRALPRQSVILLSEKGESGRPVFVRKSVKEKHLTTVLDVLQQIIRYCSKKN